MALAVVLIAAIVVATMVGHVIVSRFVDKRLINQHLNGIEAMLGVVGTLFSVLIGLLVANAIDNYHEVRRNVASEATGVADVFRISRGFESADRIRMRTLCRQYVAEVVDEEWPLMAQRKTSDKAWDTYKQLWEACVAANPINDRQNNLQQSLLVAMKNIGENRRLRDVALTQRLSPFLWFALWAGAVITVIFTYLFTASMGKLHMVMTSLIGLSLGLNIWLLAEYNTPFAGELTIPPEAFRQMRESYAKIPDTASRFLHDPVLPREGN